VIKKNKDASKYYGNTELRSSAIRLHIESILKRRKIGGQTVRENRNCFPGTLAKRLKIAPRQENVLSLRTSNALSKSNTVFKCMFFGLPHTAPHDTHDTHDTHADNQNHLTRRSRSLAALFHANRLSNIISCGPTKTPSLI
jgi:hypothetical protein